MMSLSSELILSASDISLFHPLHNPDGVLAAVDAVLAVGDAAGNVKAGNTDRESFCIKFLYYETAFSEAIVPELAASRLGQYAMG